MYKIAAAAVALAAFTTSSAFAQVLITPGIYNVTTEYTALSDPNGLCAGAGVVVGGFTTGNAYVGGVGATAHSIVAQPATSTDSPIQVNNLTCDFGAYPTSVSTTASTPFTGGATCTASYSYTLKGPVTYTLAPSSAAGSGSTINSVIPENTKDAKGVTTPLTTANSFHLTSTGTALSVSGTQICTLSTDSLYVRIGK